MTDEKTRKMEEKREVKTGQFCPHSEMHVAKWKEIYCACVVEAKQRLIEYAANEAQIMRNTITSRDAEIERARQILEKMRKDCPSCLGTGTKVKPVKDGGREVYSCGYCHEAKRFLQKPAQPMASSQEKPSR